MALGLALLFAWFLSGDPSRSEPEPFRTAEQGRLPSRSVDLEADATAPTSERETEASLSSENQQTIPRRPLDAEVEPHLGTITGTVLDPMDEPVSGVRVWVSEDDAGVTKDQWTAADGRFAFQELGEGSYRVGADPETIPVGWSAPVKQESCGSEFTPHRGARCVDIRQGETSHDVTVRLFAPSRVEGRLVDNVGTCLPNTIVNLAHGGRYFSTRTDDAGRFTFENVFPGEYQLREYPHHSTPWFYLSRSCLRVNVDSSSTTDLGDVVLGSGSCLATGRVVDETGAPIEDVLVLCYEDPGTWGSAVCYARTGPDGRFRLATLPCGTALQITVGPEYRYVGFHNWVKRRLHETVRIDTAEQQTWALGDLPVERQPLFVLRGKIVLRDQDRPVPVPSLISLRVYDTTTGRFESVLDRNPDLSFSWATPVGEERDFVLRCSLPSPDGPAPEATYAFRVRGEETRDIELVYPPDDAER